MSKVTNSSKQNDPEAISENALSPSTTTAESQNPLDEQDHDAEEKRQKEAELGKYWTAVEDNPMDFTGWTYLLQYVEQEVLIE